ncbi:MAG: dephospho-CoA kinase [Deltaproteobacteria bacterium]|nr:dephospho-CoA kinase [Deltaproteobacteria bacterium]MBN2671454.1 dephospho-CoA kinase [Deltaproteobacteria bacterium]
MNSSLRVVGLTGGIASGKSCVSKAFRNADIPVLDADSLGHMVLEPDGEAYDEVIHAFGTGILNDDRTINRQRLGKMVFDNEAERKKLESITHPAIAALAQKGMELISASGAPFAVYEAALLVETGIYRGMDALVVVSTTLENQLVRLCARDQISKKDAVTRIACQYPLDQKLKVADYVIENNGTYAELEKAALEVASRLKAQFS